jgi:lipoprotein-releasing system permease protein
MLKLLLWLKYIRRRKIVFLSITAVALSVSLLVVVANLFTSFIDSYEQLAVDVLGDVILFAPSRFPNYQSLVRQLEQTDAVVAATTTISTPGLLHLGQGNVRRVDVMGIDPAGFARVTNMKTTLLRQGHLAAAPCFDPAPEGRLGTFVGIAVLDEPDEITDTYDINAVTGKIGDDVLLTCGAVETAETQPHNMSPAIPERRTVRATITDVVFTGAYLIDKESIYVPLEAFFEILYPDQPEVLVDRIQIKLRPGIPLEVARAQILGVWRAFAAHQGYNDYWSRLAQIETAKNLQARYMREIRKQLGVLLLIFGLVDMGAVLLVFCIFYMIVQLKRRDIAIVKSCGASRMTVIWIFWGFGIVVGGVGSVAGGALGCLFTKHINALERWTASMFGIKLWDSSVYMFQQIPSHVDWLSLMMITVLATVAASAGALIPAFVAGATNPVDILRYE